MRRLFAPVVSDMAFICENGALVVKDDKILYQETFELRHDERYHPGSK